MSVVPQRRERRHGTAQNPIQTGKEEGFGLDVWQPREKLPRDRSIRLRVMPEQSNDYRVVVFGAGGVGKSSLVLRFVRGTFRETYIPTIEDTYRQVISCNKNVCTLQITDTTGSHQFPAMQRLSISKGHAFILVYSITSRQSLEELKPIYDVIREIKGDVDGIPIMLVGNKCDDPNREVSIQDGMEQSKFWSCAFLETSAKTNYNVKELFQDLLQLEKRRSMSLHLETKKTKSQKRREKLKGKCTVM
ncbi:GTP-binding protein Di-Ras2-like isoform X1 [Diadema antillarum]|uniref:GTP-binding protein Di-Ras2-like isoform X1 n=1 Tax=Diadema antillarum TaxID=105358 RepID=UPI003A837BDC